MTRTYTFFLTLLYFSTPLVGQDFDEISKWVAQVQATVDTRTQPRSQNYQFNELKMDWCQGNADKQVELLRQAIMELDDSLTVNICVKTLAQRFPSRASECFVSVLRSPNLEKTARLKILQCLALFRDPAAKDVFLNHFDHEDFMIRAAAIDGIGILYKPAYQLPKHSNGPNFNAIEWLIPVAPRIERIRLPDFAESYPPSIRKSLIKKLDNKNPLVRQAAARALVDFPPDHYELRLAEWGVWIDNGKDLVLAKSIIDEIPDFVHRTQNPFDELSKRMNHIMMINKPIIHLTTDQTLPVDVSVSITHGQPWFAYPKPNDFFIEINGPGKKIANDFAKIQDQLDDMLDNGRVPFQHISTGYPWLNLQPRKFGPTSGTMGSRNRLTGIGLEWQGLIVTPRPPQDSNLKTVSDKKFHWWNRLRNVESSWIESRSELEKFIFYDGPTSLPSFYQAKVEGPQIQLSVNRESHAGLSNEFFQRDPVRGLHIHVSESGEVSGRLFEFEFEYESKPVAGSTKREFEIPLDCNLRGEEVEDAYRKLIQMDGGLTRSEADGMIDVWRAEFFEKPGRRMLTRISRVNYDFMCPLKVRPIPTEVSRVGIVLTNLDDNMP